MPLRDQRSESGDQMFNDDDADERSGSCGLPTSSVDLLSDGWYVSQLDADTYRQLPTLFALLPTLSPPVHDPFLFLSAYSILRAGLFLSSLVGASFELF